MKRLILILFVINIFCGAFSAFGWGGGKSTAGGAGRNIDTDYVPSKYEKSETKDSNKSDSKNETEKKKKVVPSISASKKKKATKSGSGNKPKTNNPTTVVVEEEPEVEEEEKETWTEIMQRYKCPDGSYVNIGETEFKLSEHPVIKQVVEEKGYDVSDSVTEKEAEEVLADARVQAYIEEHLCEKDDSEVSSSSPEVQQAKQKLEAFFNSATSGKRDVWKDADGNFNTKRLASDLTAGVVLGTVGGVISGVVIKKKQIEKGFEALHCTVGGHKVADWGDTFTVGLEG